MPPIDQIPITVLGGYLGAGKTTVLNRLLDDPGGRRLGVIVNDFGSLALDVELLGGADADGRVDGLVSLPNGCVCCTLGSDLFDALRTMTEADPPPDHIVIEASGVADPTVAAAWGTSDGFEPGGVIVLAAADSIRRQALDKYVGGEVRRQIAGADLLIVSKTDLCTDADLAAVDAWLDDAAPGVPRISAVDGDVPTDVVLGLRPPATSPALESDGRAHTGPYVTWSWTGGRIDQSTLSELLDDLPAGLLRMKGVVELDDGAHHAIQVVGRRRDTWCLTPSVTGTRVVAIGVRGQFDAAALDRCFR